MRRTSPQRCWTFLNTVIQAATKLRAFFLALFQPIRKSVTTNMQVIQTSIFLKYSSLFAFLQRQASDVAQEVQRSYIGAARMYYETGFRRYARSLGYIKVGQSFDAVGNTRLAYRLEQPRNSTLLCQPTQTQKRKLI
jgi:hypothetical protein